jgi:hypothetical protein
LLLLPYRLGVALKILAPACAMISATKGWRVWLADACPDNRSGLGIGPGSVVGQQHSSRSAKTLNFAASSTDCPAPRTDPQQCATLARAFVQKSSLTGACVQRCFPSHRWRQPHFHLMTTMRDIDQDGFKNKNRDWNDKQYLDHCEPNGHAIPTMR